MRVLSIAATTSWGVVVGLSLFLPQTPVPAPTPSPQVPAKAAGPAPAFETAWTADVADVEAPQMAASADAVFVAGARGVRAFSAADGSALWTSPLAVASPIAVGHGQLFVYADGALQALDQRTGAVRWFSKVEAPAGGITVVAKDLVMDTGAVLRAWAGDGTVRWQIALTAPASTPAVAEGDRLFVALADQTLLAVRAADGAALWQHPLPAPASGLVAAGDRLYLGGADGAVYAFPQDGGEDPAWRFEVRAAIVGAPAVDDRCVYVALMDNTVRAFRRRSGNLCWLEQIQMRPAAGPVMIGATELAILTATGTLIALDRRTGAIVGAPVTPGAGAEGASRLLAAAVGHDGSILVLTIATGGQPTLTALRRAK